jgi:hypothetical protein
VKPDPAAPLLGLIAHARQRLVADPSPAALAEHLADARSGLDLLAAETGPLVGVGSGAGREAYGIAVARALAPPPAAIELCLPLLRTGGTLEALRPVLGFARRSHLAVRKTAPTPPGFPRRVGLAARTPIVRGGG